MAERPCDHAWEQGTTPAGEVWYCADCGEWRKRSEFDPTPPLPPQPQGAK